MLLFKLECCLHGFLSDWCLLRDAPSLIAKQLASFYVSSSMHPDAAQEESSSHPLRRAPFWRPFLMAQS